MASPANSTPPDNQSVTEVVVRLLATHIFGLSLHGHFGSLANIPSKTHATYVLCFFFNPSLVTAEICIGILRALQYYRHHPDCRDASFFMFYFEGIIGVHAVRAANQGDDRNYIDPDNHDDDTNAVPLFVIGHQRLRRKTEPVSRAWFGRVFVCLCVIAQSVGTCVIFVRRQNHGCDLFIDLTLGIMAFASSITGILVICLHFMRSKWVINASSRVLPGPPHQHWHHGTPQSLVTALVIATLTVAPLRGSYFVLILLYPLQTLFLLNPTILLSLVIILLLGYTFLRGRNFRSQFFLPPWVGFVCIVICSTLVVEDVFFLLFMSFQELRTISHGCWKDPLSDMLLVI